MMLTRPEALPDELGPAYKGRFMRYNGMSDPKLAMLTLLAWSGNAGASRREVSTVELLARVAGMDTAQFVRDHTTLPLRRAVVSKLPEIHDHGCTEHKSLLWTVALRETRPGAYFCVACIHEDLHFHGTPYWRREHQLPGLYCCAKHMLPLSYVETRDAFLDSPSAFAVNHHVVDERWVAALQVSQPIQRFLAISSDLLARSKPLDERDVSRAARARAIELKLHTGRGRVDKKLVSDLIKSRFDRDWLESVIPGLVEKPVGQYWPAVDNALLSGKRPGLSSTVYAVVFSALFESSDEAMNAMIESVPSGNAGGQPISPRVDATAYQIRAAYIANRGCHSAVARQLGLGADAARRRLLEQGLPNLGAANGSALQNAASAVFLDGASLDRACQIHGVRREDLERLLVRSASPFTSALSEIRRLGRRRASAPRAKPMAPPRQRRRVVAVEAPLGAPYIEATTPQNVAQ
jgi:hypothetical protein